MAKISLKERILAYFKARPGHPIPSGEIQRLVVTHTKYTPANATRRLRELAEENELDVEIVKGHAVYTYKKPALQRKRTIIIENGVAREIYQMVCA